MSENTEVTPATKLNDGIDLQSNPLVWSIWIKNTVDRARWFFKPLIFALIYGAWILSFRLLTLTFIAYSTISPTSHFQDMSDAFSSNEISIISLAAVLFVGLLCSLSPLTSTSLSDIVSQNRIERGFLPGFLYGALFSCSLVLVFILLGIYRYLGYYIQLNEAPIELVNILLRMIALVAFVYCEEFLFRKKILKAFRGHLPDFTRANLAALLYCGVKLLQFDIGIMHCFSLYLVSIVLFYLARKEGQFARGAGFWAAILVVFHPLLSLPIFGNDFSGILLLKVQPIAFSQNSQNLSQNLSDQWNAWIRFLTGGAGGPLASFAFQSLLILSIGRSILQKKTLKTQ